jgi:hypothetical protein
MLTAGMIVHNPLWKGTRLPVNRHWKEITVDAPFAGNCSNHEGGEVALSAKGPNGECHYALQETLTIMQTLNAIRA